MSVFRKAKQLNFMKNPPQPINNYLKSPRASLTKFTRWLNALWQLRKCTKVGAWTRVQGKVFVQNDGQIIVGERVLISSRYAHNVFATFNGGILEIGDRTFINYGVDIAATELVRIGKDCLIGTHVIILDNDFHELVERHLTPKPQPVIVGNKVWVGNRVTILPGVTIGEGSVIGAGSVVVHSIPAYSVAVGNPARVIKQLQTNNYNEDVSNKPIN
jgi:acetyltransferase-like isoleucine patch superfamily enzyme